MQPVRIRIVALCCKIPNTANARRVGSVWGSTSIGPILNEHNGHWEVVAVDERDVVKGLLAAAIQGELSQRDGQGTLVNVRTLISSVVAMAYSQLLCN